MGNLETGLSWNREECVGAQWVVVGEHWLTDELSHFASLATPCWKMSARVERMV